MTQEQKQRFALELRALLRRYKVASLQGWKHAHDADGRIEGFDADDNGLFTIHGPIRATGDDDGVSEYEK